MSRPSSHTRSSICAQIRAKARRREMTFPRFRSYGARGEEQAPSSLAATDGVPRCHSRTISQTGPCIGSSPVVTRPGWMVWKVAGLGYAHGRHQVSAPRHVGTAGAQRTTGRRGLLEHGFGQHRFWYRRRRRRQIRLLDQFGGTDGRYPAGDRIGIRRDRRRADGRVP